MKVNTIEGLVDFSELDVRDIVTYTDTTREIRTEWYRKSNGKFMRSDGHVSFLRTEAQMDAEQGRLTPG